MEKNSLSIVQQYPMERFNLLVPIAQEELGKVLYNPNTLLALRTDLKDDPF